MAFSKPPLSSPGSLDEQEWLDQIRGFIENEIEEADVNVPVSIFNVPQLLHSIRPEAYAPQLFAFGPYHHWRNPVYDMERYKLAAAKRTQSRLRDRKFHELVDQLKKREYKIRAYYHRHLDLSGETLAWMIAIDASFLIEFLQNFAEKEGNADQAAAKSKSSQNAASESMRIVYNMMLKDIMMLENQIPLFVLRKILYLQFESKEVTNTQLSKIMVGFAKEVSPFKTMVADHLSADDIVRHAHLLDLLYRMIIPKPIEDCETIEIVSANGTSEPKEAETIDPSQAKKHLKLIWKFISSVGIAPIKRIMASGPIKFIVKVPWKVITALPIVSIIKQPVENYFSEKLTDKSKSDEDETKKTGHEQPTVEEISIPSVAELVKTGVKFSTIKGDLTTIEFDNKSIVLYLPAITFDVNTEVILRNLVAYEASVAPGPLVFTRYTELMNGIIDTEEDVRILRDRGIVVNKMKSDKEAAELWNGMSRAVRLTKVGFLDRAIADVNRYYESRWRVKSDKLMKKYIYGSWQVLTLLGALLLLFLTCVQSFCSVYSCNSRLTEIATEIASNAPPSD